MLITTMIFTILCFLVLLAIHNVLSEIRKAISVMAVNVINNSTNTYGIPKEPPYGR